MAKISIIIPAYNSEMYIDKCIESIVNQTYIDWEIIIVIDGSEDHTEEKARVWEEKNTNIRVLSQKNQGAGPARNNGLCHATGEYVMFIDPDDWIERTMLEVYIREIDSNNGCDLLISDSICDYYDGNKYLYSDFKKVEPLSCCSKEEIRHQYFKLFVNGLVRGPVCKLYKKEIIDKYRLGFPSLRRSQDIVFNYLYYDHISSIKVFDSHFYHYRCLIDKQEKKITPDYYLAISQIYREVIMAHERWGVNATGIYYEGFCEYLFNALVFQLQIGESKDNMHMILSDPYIIKLAMNTKTHNWKKKIVRFLLLLNKPHLLNFLISLNKINRKRK